jgi:hypothetical protein
MTVGIALGERAEQLGQIGDRALQRVAEEVSALRQRPVSTWLVC